MTHETSGRRTPSSFTASAHLTVKSLPEGADGQDVCLVDAEIMEEIGVGEMGVVEMSTVRDRRFLARVNAHEGMRGTRTCQLGRSQRRATKLAVGDSVGIRAVEVGQAKRVVLEPLAPLSQHLQAYEDELSESLSNRQALVQEGMLVAGRLADFRRDVYFRVLAVSPDHAVVTDDTRVVLRTSMLAPGASANLVSFDDVGGLSSHVERLRDLIECPLLFPDTYIHLGIQPPRGVLLYGPPGVGKTHLARAAANEIGAHFVYVNGPEVLSSVHGGTEANLRAVFEEAMVNSPSIVLIDELDSIAPRRDESGQIDARMGTQLLSLLDGLVSMEDVVVLGTTNRVDAIDPALRRPGRFDREIFVGPPDAAGRLEIFKIHTRGMPLTENAQSLLPDLAQATHGYTGADIVDLLREAGLHALRRIVGPAELAGQAETLMGCAVEPNDLQDALEHTRPSSLRQTLMAATRASWDDIVGQDAVVQRLREAVEMPLTHRMAFDDIGLVASPGVVLHGPPGSGKTVLAMAVAHESHANVVTLNGPEVFSKWLGKSEEAVREVFRLARQASPTVVILDQLDAMASRRSDSSSSSALERVVNQLLIELDDVASRNLSVIGITNRLDLVDPALLRPGRLGIHIAVELPDASERAAMIRRYLRGSTTAKDGDATTWSVVAKVADVSVGLSGADLRAVCNDARILALRDAGYRVGARVEPKHLEQAFEAQQRQPRESALVRQDIHHKVVSREWSVDEVV